MKKNYVFAMGLLFVFLKPAWAVTPQWAGPFDVTEVHSGHSVLHFYVNIANGPVLCGTAANSTFEFYAQQDSTVESMKKRTYAAALLAFTSNKKILMYVESCNGTLPRFSAIRTLK